MNPGQAVRDRGAVCGAGVRREQRRQVRDHGKSRLIYDCCFEYLDSVVSAYFRSILVMYPLVLGQASLRLHLVMYLRLHLLLNKTSTKFF